MTDEELVEAQIKEWDNLLYPQMYSVALVKHFIRKAFLAGLKAGRPKFHKVIDGDLPEEHKIYLVAIKDNGLAIAYFNGLHWETKFNLGDFGHCVETVIAWCEIPKFEEDE